MIRVVALSIGLVVVAGCAVPASTIPRPDSYYSADHAVQPTDDAMQNDTDINFQETVLKARPAAAADALARVAEDVVGFLAAH